MQQDCGDTSLNNNDNDLSEESTAPTPPPLDQAHTDRLWQNMSVPELHELPLHVFLIDLFLTVWRSRCSPGSSFFMPHASKARTDRGCLCVLLCAGVDVRNRAKQQTRCRECTLATYKTVIVDGERQSTEHVFNIHTLTSSYLGVGLGINLIYCWFMSEAPAVNQLVKHLFM